MTGWKDCWKDDVMLLPEKEKIKQNEVGREKFINIAEIIMLITS